MNYMNNYIEQKIDQFKVERINKLIYINSFLLIFYSLISFAVCYFFRINIFPFAKSIWMKSDLLVNYCSQIECPFDYKFVICSYVVQFIFYESYIFMLMIIFIFGKNTVSKKIIPFGIFVFLFILWLNYAMGFELRLNVSDGFSLKYNIVAKYAIGILNPAIMGIGFSSIALRFFMKSRNIFLIDV